MGNRMIITDDDLVYMNSYIDDIDNIEKVEVIFNNITFSLLSWGVDFIYTYKGNGKHFVEVIQNGIKVGYSSYEQVGRNKITIKSNIIPVSPKILKKLKFKNKDYQLKKIDCSAESVHFIMGFLHLISFNREIHYKDGECVSNNHVSCSKVHICSDSNIEIKMQDLIIKHTNTNSKSDVHYKGSWEVRGHFRTLKSGKKVFVKPYKKGLGITNNKNYII